MQTLSTNNPKSIGVACETLARGKLVIYPTETCYGIAADAGNPEAVNRLLAYKGDRQRQVSIAVTDQAMAKRYVDLNSIALNLYKEFLPGPITVISQSLGKVDARLESAEGSLGVRIPKYDFALKLISAFDNPITATSANTSGKKEPYSLEDWQKYTTAKKCDMVSLFLDAGKLKDRPTSTVVDTTLNSPEILRQGEIILPDSSPSFVSESEQATISFAKNLIGKYLNLTRKYPLIIALQGELGVGKTRVCKGIARELGVTDNVASPTYTLMKEYPYPQGSELLSSSEPNAPKYSGIFYHLDTWRLHDAGELESTLHLSSLLKPGNIIALEWAGKAKKEIKKYNELYPTILIDIKEISPSTRLITYSLSTPEWS